MRSIPFARIAAFLSSIAVVVHSSKAALADGMVLQTDPYAARKVFYEEHWQCKIEAALAYIEGAIICVNVDLAPEIDRWETKDAFEKQTVAEFTVSKEREEEQNSVDASRVALGPGERSRPGGSKTSEIEEYTKNAIPKTQVVTSFAGLTPSRVSASIGIPKSYYEAVWAKRRHQESPRPSDPNSRKEALKQIEGEINSIIERTVVVLLGGRDTGQNRFARVQVTSFEDLPGAGQQAARRRSQWPLTRHDAVTVTFADHRNNGPIVADLLSGNGQPDDGVLRIAAKIANVRPNGDLVIEGQRIEKAKDVVRWVEITGVVRPESIGPNGRTIPSNRISELRIDARAVVSKRRFSLFEF